MCLHVIIELQPPLNLKITELQYDSLNKDQITYLNFISMMPTETQEIYHLT